LSLFLSVLVSSVIERVNVRYWVIGGSSGYVHNIHKSNDRVYEKDILFTMVVLGERASEFGAAAVREVGNGGGNA
jgi:hypothetical protein